MKADIELAKNINDKKAETPRQSGQVARAPGQEPGAVIENIPFRNPKKRAEAKPKRKEINLAELRKALDESLSAPAESLEEIVKEAASPKNELEKRIDEEKYEDKSVEIGKPVAPIGPIQPVEPAKNNKKKQIKPGETVKL